jgi:outer membrane protein assembly factor BamB
MGGYGMVDAVDIRTHAVRWRSAPAIGGSVSPLLHVGDTQSSISGAEHFVADGLVYVIEHVERSIRGPDKIQREYRVRVFALDALNGELKWSWSQPTEGASQSAAQRDRRWRHLPGG